MSEDNRRRGHKTYRGYGLPLQSEDDPPEGDGNASIAGDTRDAEAGDAFAPATIPAAAHPDIVVEVPNVPAAARAPGRKGEEDESGMGEGSGDKAGPADKAGRSRRGGTPLLEIEVIHEHGPAPSTDRPWRTVEVWTRNRLYILDSHMTCIEVHDRATRETAHDHPFLGMRLVGGQHRSGEAIELSYPFPRPGTEAVFERLGSSRAGSFSRTSAVSRVVLRLHIVTVAPNYVVPTWEEITGGFDPPQHRFVSGSGSDDET